MPGMKLPDIPTTLIFCLGRPSTSPKRCCRLPFSIGFIALDLRGMRQTFSKNNNTTTPGTKKVLDQLYKSSLGHNSSANHGGMKQTFSKNTNTITPGTKKVLDQLYKSSLGRHSFAHHGGMRQTFSKNNNTTTPGTKKGIGPTVCTRALWGTIHLQTTAA
jgi:hypothetical protein